MKITNKLGLPQPLVDAVSDSWPPKPGRIGVTELIDSPQVRRLRAEHWAEMEEDASDRIWALLGTAVHRVLEKSGGDNAEKKLTATCSKTDVVGKIDYVKNGELLDFKITSVWSVIYKSRSEDWAKQLNVYRWLCAENGIAIASLHVFAILRDWVQSKAGRDQYPEHQIINVEIPLWDLSDTEKYVMERVSIHERASEVSTCSDEERWKNPDVWAVMREGRKTALRLHDSEAMAKQQIETMADKKNFIQHRPGGYRRCEQYCAVSQFCTQFKQEKSK